MQAARNGIQTFRESMLNPDLNDGRSLGTGSRNAWGLWRERDGRYAVNWAMYQNNAYRDIHLWAARLRTTYGLSKLARHIYNPAGQLGDFYASHVWGGTLDVNAGDGESEKSALPILTDIEALRPPIAKLRIDSRWQVNKDICTLWGAVLGDVAIKVVDDTARGMIRKELVYPGHLVDVLFDEQKHVKGYLIEKYVRDPDWSLANGLLPLSSTGDLPRMCLYSERCTRDGDLVVYETFKDGKPYPWNGERDTWTEKYGFVPLALIQHRSIGLDWGAACFQGSISRFIEIDDQASCLSRNNRKMLEAPMFIEGVKGPADIKIPGTNRSQRTAADNYRDPEPSASEMPFLYGPVGSRPWPLTMPFDIPGMVTYLDSLTDSIEKKHPELLADTGIGGRVTAEAVRNARQIGSGLVQGVRPGYDDAEVRTNQMALAIGGFRGYAGYDGFGLESYKSGGLDHQIGHRSVFEVDPMDDLAEDKALWDVINAQIKAGLPLNIALERNGWSAKELAALAVEKAREPAPMLAAPGGKPPMTPMPA